MKEVNEVWDYIIVGSGFGGSVAALRLAEKGYRVCVLEKGKRYRDDDFAKSNWQIRKYLWMPLLKCFGIQNLSLFKNILILSGCGVGGGSLVYANTLLKPGHEFFEAPAWSGLANWESELTPHYETAKRMLGVTTNPCLTFVDDILQKCAEDLGKEETFLPAEVGVFFGEPGKTVPDPYFGGQGPHRTGCIQCGGCMVGCRHGSKNTLVKNYLFFAEKLGANILPETQAKSVRPLEPGSDSANYEVEIERSTAWFAKKKKTLRAKNVILAGGVLGTIQLLLHCKWVSKTLSHLSDRLGNNVRTNSEALVGVSELSASKDRDYSRGIAITSIFHPDEHTHIEPVRYPRGSGFMRLLAAPMVDGGGKFVRPLKLAWAILRHPMTALRLFVNPDWAGRTVIFLVMQTLDNRLRFNLDRNIFTLFRKKMTTAPEPDSAPVPSYIPIGNQVARNFAAKVEGVPQSAINEVLMDIPTTAHILGGCPIGKSAADGVIDHQHRVFGYPGLYVCDGSAIPANLGVNPSLTITAMTERAMSLIPQKSRSSSSLRKNLAEGPHISDHA